MEGLDHGLVPRDEGDVHLVQPCARTLDPIGRPRGPDPQIGNGLFGAVAEQEGLRRIAGGLQTQSLRHGVIEAAGRRQVRNDDPAVVQHDDSNDASTAPFPFAKRCGAA
jgi:hypothetical protein